MGKIDSPGKALNAKKAILEFLALTALLSGFCEILPGHCVWSAPTLQAEAIARKPEVAIAPLADSQAFAVSQRRDRQPPHQLCRWSPPCAGSIHLPPLAQAASLAHSWIISSPSIYFSLFAFPNPPPRHAQAPCLTRFAG